jgi:hypothetical protein
MTCINRIRRLFPLAGEASLDLRAWVAANGFRTLSAQSAKEEASGNPSHVQEVMRPQDEIPDPPGVFQTVGAMGAGGKVNQINL